MTENTEMRSKWNAINGNGHDFKFPTFLHEEKSAEQKLNDKVKFAAGGAVMINCITKRLIDGEKEGNIPEGTLKLLVEDLSELMVQTADMGLEGIV